MDYHDLNASLLSFILILVHVLRFKELQRIKKKIGIAIVDNVK